MVTRFNITRSTFTPSRFQQTIFDWTEDWTPFGKRNAVITAVAGSGKTTTLEHMVMRIPSRFQILMTAFNKSIADEMRRRMPMHCNVMTLNGLGYRAWLNFLGPDTKLAPDGQKTRQIMREVLSYEENAQLGMQVNKLVSLAKAHGVVPQGAKTLKGLMDDCDATWSFLIDRFEIDFEQKAQIPRAIVLAREVLKKSIQMSKAMIDYDDQLYMPVIANVPMSQYPWVMVDEAQDLSAIQRVLVKRSLAPEGRFVAVGDRNQAIYGFRGADSDSIDRIVQDFDAIELPLSITFRCPKKVVALAKEIVPQIEAAETAEEGIVEEPRTYSITMFEPSHMLICRCVAPLVSFAYKLISHRIPARVLGRDIGQGLIGLVDKMKAEYIDGDSGLLAKLDRWEQKEIARFAREDREDKIQSVADKVDTIRTIVEACPDMETTAQLRREIETMFASDEQDAQILTLSTVHKAKGLEADVVWVLEPKMMPLRSAKQEWQKQQELNLKYVAFTRARKVLRLIASRGLTDADGKLLMKQKEEREGQPRLPFVPAPPPNVAAASNAIFSALGLVEKKHADLLNFDDDEDDRFAPETDGGFIKRH